MNLVSNVETKSTLYQTLEAMSLLYTEDCYVRRTRQALHDLKTITCNISNKDVNGIGYRNSHISIHLCEYPTYSNPDQLDIYVQDQHINNSDIEWIETEVYLHAILPHWYDDNVKATVICHGSVAKRYSVTAKYEGNYVHIVTIDFTKGSFQYVQNPYTCLYYYTDGTLNVPNPDQIAQNGDGTFTYTIPYRKTLDAYWCYDLIMVQRVKANETFYLHSPELKRTYPRIYVDTSDTYPIDTLFYPCARVDKDCIIRVFSDSASVMNCPEAARLILYPEFLDIEDPYDTDDPRLSAIKPCDVWIKDTDSDDYILEQFKELAPSCYRIWEHFPTFSNEMTDFLILDNTNWDDERIVKAHITRLDGTEEDIITITAPYEGYRDILFYDGWICSDYDVMHIRDGKEDPSGIPSYVIRDLTRDLNKFQLIKFNSGEDTNFVNIGDWINQDNLVQLHQKLNRFYRNMLILRGGVLDGVDGDERVRIATVPPTITDDDRLWFELLVNTIPDTFESRQIEAIEMAGLDPNTIPEGIKAGAYAIDIDPDDGPKSYNQIVNTYFEYQEALQDSLVFDNLEPRLAEIDAIEYGDLPIDANPNDIVLQDAQPGGDNTSSDGYYSGDEETDGSFNEGDLIVDAILQKYVDENGLNLTKTQINKMSRASKIALIRSLTANEQKAIEWTTRLENLARRELNSVTYNSVKTAYYYNQLSGTRTDADTSLTKEQAIYHDLNLVISDKEPIAPEVNALWIDIPAIMLEDFIEVLIGNPIWEVNSYEMIQGVHQMVTDKSSVGTIAFDNMAHGGPDEIELFQEKIDDTLYPVAYGDEPAAPAEGDVWYEFIKDIHGKVAYADQQCMVLRIDERLIMVEFVHDNITAFMFDDILMNFKGSLGIRYLSVVADLINSGVITKNDINIFYQRLITGPDEFDPRMQRLYNGRSHVITRANVDTTDLGILYSTNIGRFHVDYTTNQITNWVREWSWRHVIDYRQMDMAIIQDRMLVFVNGRLMNMTDWLEPAGGMYQLLNFDEVIRCVDVLYAKKDIPLSKLKRIAINCWKDTMDEPEINVGIKEKCNEMVPIINTEYTDRGYYDILLDDYILNGKLMRYINYFIEHPEEFEDFRNDLLTQFHEISDVDPSGQTPPDEYPRIIISGCGNNALYQIGTA